MAGDGMGARAVGLPAWSGVGSADPLFEYRHTGLAFVARALKGDAGRQRQTSLCGCVCVCVYATYMFVLFFVVRVALRRRTAGGAFVWWCNAIDVVILKQNTHCLNTPSRAMRSRFP